MFDVGDVPLSLNDSSVCTWVASASWVVAATGSAIATSAPVVDTATTVFPSAGGRPYWRTGRTRVGLAPPGNGAVCSIPAPALAIALSQNHRVPSGETSQACTSEAIVILLAGSPAPAA